MADHQQAVKSKDTNAGKILHVMMTKHKIPQEETQILTNEPQLTRRKLTLVIGQIPASVTLSTLVFMWINMVNVLSVTLQHPLLLLSLFHRPILFPFIHLAYIFYECIFVHSHVLFGVSL